MEVVFELEVGDGHAVELHPLAYLLFDIVFLLLGHEDFVEGVGFLVVLLLLLQDGQLIVQDLVRASYLDVIQVQADARHQEHQTIECPDSDDVGCLEWHFL